MNRLDLIRELFAYNAWANARVLDAAATLTDAEFVRDLGSSFPSVRDTLVHLLSADWVWLERLDGRSPGAMPAGWQGSTLAEIRDRWAAIEDARGARLAALSDGELDRVLEYRNLAGAEHRSTLHQVLLHLVNHSTYHRGQLTTMLRQLGAAPPATDFILYSRVASPSLPPA